MILESPCLIPDFKGKGAAYFVLFNVPGGKNKQGIILATRRLNGKAPAYRTGYTSSVSTGRAKAKTRCCSNVCDSFRV